MTCTYVTYNKNKCRQSEYDMFDKLTSAPGILLFFP